MQTPSDVSQLKGLYLIDRPKYCQLWYLWTVKDGEWAALKTGDWETIVKKLGQLKEGEKDASDHIQK